VIANVSWQPTSEGCSWARPWPPPTSSAPGAARGPRWRSPSRGDGPAPRGRRRTPLRRNLTGVRTL
jgi:hypothetical protein